VGGQSPLAGVIEPVTSEGRQERCDVFGVGVGRDGGPARLLHLAVEFSELAVKPVAFLGSRYPAVGLRDRAAELARLGGRDVAALVGRRPSPGVG